MCVYSMIADSWIDRLTPMVPAQPPIFPPPVVVPIPNPTPSILVDFKFLEEQLRKAAEYDRKNNEPDCELEEKKETLRRLAKQLGVEISFPGEQKKEGGE